LRKGLKYAYLTAGMVCFGYYFLLGYSSRFGLSMSWIWILGGIALCAAGFVCGSGGIPRWLRIAWRALLCGGLALVMALECLVISGMNSAPPQGLDYLIVLGARVEGNGPSPALRRRLNAALAYLEENPDTIVIASGGQGSDEIMSEAECIRRELVAAGVDESRILLEENSTDTAENLRYSKELLPSADVSVGLVTNNFHVYRAVKLADAAGLENVCGVAAEYTGYTLFHYMIREAFGLTMDYLRGRL